MRVTNHCHSFRRRRNDDNFKDFVRGVCVWVVWLVEWSSEGNFSHVNYDWQDMVNVGKNSSCIRSNFSLFCFVYQMIRHFRWTMIIIHLRFVLFCVHCCSSIIVVGEWEKIICWWIRFSRIVDDNSTTQFTAKRRTVNIPGRHYNILIHIRLIQNWVQ